MSEHYLEKLSPEEKIIREAEAAGQAIMREYYAKSEADATLQESLTEANANEGWPL